MTQSHAVATRAPLSPETGSRARFVGLACLCLGLQVGCAPQKVDMRAGARYYEPDDYQAILRLWTREDRLNTIEAMDNVLTVTSTYESWDFRHAYATRYARDYGLSKAESSAFLARSLDEHAAHHQFYVALFGTISEYGDLTRKEPAWVVSLVSSDGSETKPSDIVRIKDKDISAATKAYFPYTNSWRTAYRISFPKTGPNGQTSLDERGTWFGLRFRGPQGETTLVWEIRK